MIDTDPGIDDMMALFFALSAHKRGELKILGLTITHGNSDEMETLARCCTPANCKSGCQAKPTLNLWLLCDSPDIGTLASRLTSPACRRRLKLFVAVQSP